MHRTGDPPPAAAVGVLRRSKNPCGQRIHGFQGLSFQSPSNKFQSLRSCMLNVITASPVYTCRVQREPPRSLVDETVFQLLVDRFHLMPSTWCLVFGQSSEAVSGAKTSHGGIRTPKGHERIASRWGANAIYSASTVNQTGCFFPTCFRQGTRRTLKQVKKEP